MSKRCDASWTWTVVATIGLAAFAPGPAFGTTGRTVEVKGKAYTVVDHREDHPMAPLTAADESRGYVVFSRPNPGSIYPASYPRTTEIARRLSTFAARGEYEPVFFAVYALGDLKNFQVEVGELVDETGQKLPKDCVDLRMIKGFIQRADNVYRWEPEILDKIAPADLKNRTAQQYCVTLRIPPNLPAGKYTGRIKLNADNAQSSEIELRLKVLPFALVEELPHRIGTWTGVSAMAPHPKYGTRFSWEEIPARFKDMKAHGMNCIVWDSPEATFASRLMGAPGSKKLQMDFATDNKIAELYKQAGFTGPIVVELSKFTCNLAAFMRMDFPDAYYRGSNRGSHCQPPVDKTPPEYIEAYKEGLRQMARNAKENDWPELIWHINDEPAHQGMEVIKTAAAQYRWAKKATPQVKTWCTIKPKGFSLARQEKIFRLFHPNLDIRAGWFWDAQSSEFHQEMLRKGIYKEMWGQTGPANTATNAYARARGNSGFKLRRSGFSGMVFWMYGNMGQTDGKGGHSGTKGDDWDPYVHIPTRRTALSYRSPRDLSPVATLAWEGTREGLDDLKYIVTLEGLIAEAKDSDSEKTKAAALSAEEMLKSILRAVPLGVAGPSKWEKIIASVVSNPKMNQYRWRVARRIMKLSESLGR